MPNGIIMKALSGYYYVLPNEEGATIVQCRARGIFKKRGITPLVGDRVVYKLTDNGEGSIQEIMLPRSSELIRPPIANVDLAVLVFSFVEPELNLQLLDKFLVHTEHAGIDSIICFSKYDLISQDDEGASELSQFEQVIRLYEQIGYRVMTTSAVTGEGASALEQALENHIAVFSGQSGVGKSSMLNAMLPGLELETNEISSKLGRGKHTTRHVQLFALPGGGVVADTPGFSQLDFMEIEAEDLGNSFKEFSRIASRCKFRGCLHHREPNCEVIAALERGEIATSRYEHYLGFLEEIKDKKRRY